MGVLRVDYTGGRGWGPPMQKGKEILCLILGGEEVQLVESSLYRGGVRGFYSSGEGDRGSKRRFGDLGMSGGMGEGT